MPVPGTSEVIRTEDVGRVRIVTMHRPERLNAFNLDLIAALHGALESAADDDAVHVVVLTGTGRAFSSGADLAEMGRAKSAESAGSSGVDLFDKLQKVAEAFPKPLIAAVNGLGVGFGFTILGYCDFCFVAASARLRTPFSQLGLSPEASSSYLFPLRMGWAAAARALMLGDWFSAQDVVDAGLAQEVVPDDRLMAVATAFAQRLAECPLQSLTATKSLMLQAHLRNIAATREAERDSLARLIGTPANRAAIKAFSSRKPQPLTGQS